MSSFLTSVYTGEPPTEVHEGWQLLYAVLLSVADISNLDKGDIKVVCLIVYLLQLCQNLLALGIFLIWLSDALLVE